MISKTVEILLVFNPNPAPGVGNYLVKRTKNTTEYVPGVSLKKAEVDMLINRRGWSVSVVGE